MPVPQRMTRDDLEFSISQYLDGTLADGERSALEERLARDAEARALLAEEEALNAVLKRAKYAAMPAVRWDHLPEAISAAIDEQRATGADEQPAEPMPMRLSTGGRQSARPSRSSWTIRLWMPAGLAAAASVLIAAGFG